MINSYLVNLQSILPILIAKNNIELVMTNFMSQFSTCLIYDLATKSVSLICVAFHLHFSYSNQNIHGL
jgi:hypothetical protein